MPCVCLVVAYDGTEFVGWQRQVNGLSVQEAIETALERLVGHPVRCRGAGRTDAGVHAAGQVVTFQTERVLPERAFVHGVNHHLPPSVVVQSARFVPDAFDARFSASGKLYRYQIWNAPVRSPLHARTHWHIERPLDVDAMTEAAQLLTGRHDFRAFRAADCERKTTTRWVKRLSVTRSCLDAAALHVEVEATAFLKNMVRILTGTLVEVGRGRMTPAHVAGLLASGDRTQAGPTAPPQGLIMVRVDYGPREGP